MKLVRTWAMPNCHTFRIKPIHKLLKQFIPKPKGMIVDPFSGGEKEFATITNDLNPKVDADYHLDAIKFLKMLPSNQADIILYDPPYSPRQVSECYHNFGYNVTMQDTSAKWRSIQLNEIARIVKPHGICISFGWNTNGVGKKHHFRIIGVLVVAHGGSHNDTLVTIEKKMRVNKQISLF